MFARSMRSMFAAALVTLSVVPAAAFADSSPANTGDGTSTHVRHDKKEKASFPMPAATFKSHVEKRIAKMRERVNGHIDKKNVPADKRKVILSKLDANAVKVIAEVDKLGADGTITQDEAKQVHTLARTLRQEAKRDRAKQSQK